MMLDMVTKSQIIKGKNYTESHPNKIILREYILRGQKHK